MHSSEVWRTSILVEAKDCTQEARVMKSTSDHEPKWRNLFDKQVATMEEAALMVLYRQEDPKEVLCSAINQLKNRPFDEVFAPISAVREVVKAAIARNDEESKETALAPQRFGRLGSSPLES